MSPLLLDCGSFKARQRIHGALGRTLETKLNEKRSKKLELYESSQIAL